MPLRLLAAFFCTLPLAAFAEAPPQTLAVAAVEARGGASAELAAQVNDALVAQLVQGGRFRVVERQQLARVMKEQALSQSGMMSDDQQVKLAQLVGARFLAVGAVQTSGKGFLLTLRALDSSTAQVAFADNLKVGATDQLDAGARQLARKLEEKLAGAPAAAATEAIGDFDAAQVKDGARQLARSLAVRLPKAEGKVGDALPDGTATCSFPDAQPFSGQRFEIRGTDEVTGQEVRKGWFLLRSFSKAGCSGVYKRDGGADVAAGDTLQALPMKVGVEAVEPAAGAQPELVKLLSDELRAALDALPQFQVAPDPQLTVTGRVGGARGQRSVDLQVVDAKGNVVAKLQTAGAF